MSTKYANVFAKGIFGIYLRQDTTPHIKINIKAILPTLWERIDISTKNDIATAYAIYLLNEEKEKADLARAFISIVGGEEYLPDNIRGYEIKIAINQLLSIHRSMNNFYNEPQIAKQLERLVGNRSIPEQLDKHYVLGIVDVFLTNGYGVCWTGDEIYKKLINQFTEKQAFIAATSFKEERIANKLSRSLSKEKFKELLNIIRNNSTNTVLINFVYDILSYKGGFENLYKDSLIKQKLETLRILY